MVMKRKARMSYALLSITDDDFLGRELVDEVRGYNE
jgi:hypothetical protein